MFDYSNKVILVTGASKGIGKSIALNFAKSNPKQIIITSRSENDLKKVSDQIKEISGLTPEMYVGSNGDSNFLNNLTSDLLSKYNSIDILVNNGGGPKSDTFSNLDTLDWKTTYEEILYGPISLITTLSINMKKNNWGRVINISSLVATEPAGAMVLSATFRAGLIAFCKSISAELVASGVTINTVSPSAVDTDRSKDLTNQAAKKLNKTYEEVMVGVKKSIPIGRLASPDEISSTVLYLASDGASYINGQNIIVDGGLSKST